MSKNKAPVAPVKKELSKEPKKTINSDDEDDIAPIIKKTKSVLPTKTKPKKVDDDEEEEDDVEEEKPVNKKKTTLPPKKTSPKEEEEEEEEDEEEEEEEPINKKKTTLPPKKTPPKEEEDDDEEVKEEKKVVNKKTPPKEEKKEVKKEEKQKQKQKQKKENKQTIIRMKNLEAKSFVFEPVKDVDGADFQKIGFVKYKDVEKGDITALFQTHHIKLEGNAIWKYNKKIANGIVEDSKEDTVKRGVAMLHLNEANPESKEVKKKIDALDKLMETPEVKLALLGKKHDSYVYSPLVNKNEKKDDDDESGGKKKIDFPKFPYIKGKLIIGKDDGEIKTDIYLRTPKLNEEGEEVIDSKGKKQYIREHQKDITTLKQLESILRKGAVVGALMSISKSWAQKSSTGTGKKLYGLTFKIHQLEYEPSESSGLQLNKEEGSFISEDEEEN